MPVLAQPRRWVYRYPVAVRVSHWVNVLCLAVLVMSGLQIFNAHPALYWGEDSDFDSPFFSIGARRNNEGRPIGVTTIFDTSFDTTGVLGWSRVRGRPAPRAFPAWLTIPSVQDLATGVVCGTSSSPGCSLSTVSSTSALRSPVGTHDPFCWNGAVRCLCRRPCSDGSDDRGLEQPTVDDHGVVCRRSRRFLTCRPASRVSVDAGFWRLA